MHICLLKCGSVLPDLKHISGDHDDMFIALFKKYAPSIHFSVYDIQKDHYPENLDKFSGFLSTGSPYSVYQSDPWIAVYKSFTLQLFKEKRKHVGICFGHQMIAAALGGKVEKSKNDWGIGIKESIVKSTQPWMNNNMARYKLIVSHQDQVVKLPENAKILAGNEHCPVGMFSINNYVLGIQQHPEFTKEYLKASINSRKAIIKESLIKSALASLDQKTDSKVITKWIESFFKYQGNIHG